MPKNIITISEPFGEYHHRGLSYIPIRPNHIYLTPEQAKNLVEQQRKSNAQRKRVFGPWFVDEKIAEAGRLKAMAQQELRNGDPAEVMELLNDLENVLAEVQTEVLHAHVDQMKLASVAGGFNGGYRYLPTPAELNRALSPHLEEVVRKLVPDGRIEKPEYALTRTEYVLRAGEDDELTVNLNTGAWTDHGYLGADTRKSDTAGEDVIDLVAHLYSRSRAQSVELLARIVGWEVRQDD